MVTFLDSGNQISDTRLINDRRCVAAHKSQHVPWATSYTIHSGGCGHVTVGFYSSPVG